MKGLDGGIGFPVLTDDDPSKAEILKAAKERQRKAQFFIDFVEAENSSGFHAPQEAARIFADAINEIRLGQNELRK
jgi:nitrite reductase (cytochrome c-552)